ncbi:zinc-ribbon domain-containing protein [Mycobacterium sp. MS1601]|uniref:zinc-ribbon domain-containing protein n=1 Tax=Mycobacterium sp. MS1601 TaxID=1936029 RepID=UPI003FA59ED1
MPGSNAKVWWVCRACGHEWSTQVNSRARRGSSCQKCWHVRRGILRATPKPGRSLGDLFPDVAAEWSPTRNGDLKPIDVKPASNKRVWWLCKQGHEWEVPPCDRLRGEQCPVCAEAQRHLTKSTPKPGRSLADLFPDVAVEWHPTRNGPLTAGDVNPGSRPNRWWKCKTCAHEWSTSAAKRTTRSQGCPMCSYARISRTKSKPKPGESLAERMPELASEWHPTLNLPLTPFDIRPRGNASVWWQCQFGHQWKAKVAPRAVGVGCPHCSIVGVSEREIRLKFELAAAGLSVQHDYPPIAVPTRRRPVKADIVLPDIRLVIEYDGSYYHANKLLDDQKQTAALESAGWTVLRVRERPLGSLGGHEVFVSPTEPVKSLAISILRALTDLGVVAPKGAEYQKDPELWGQAAANTALNRHRSRSLASELPDLAKQFHPRRNGALTPGSVHPGNNEKFWWLCPDCGHEWEAVLASRAAGRGCPPCGVQRRAERRAVPRPGNSFQDLFPEVAKEWHPTRNHPLTPMQVSAASNRLVWWQCHRGHEWEARVAFRREFGRCKKCPTSESGRKRTRR